MANKEKEIVMLLKEPRLTCEEKLYIKAYFSTLKHSKAYSILRPDLKSHNNNNPFSRSDAVQYHIKKGMIQKMESLDLSSDKILDLLLQEATRLGNGSSPTARVQALTLLGKQLGLFEEKKEEREGVTFNIINYKPVEESVLEIEEVKKEDTTPLPLDIKIETYNDNQEIT